MKAIVATSLALTLMAGAAPAQDDQETSISQSGDDLVQVDGSHQETWVRPGVDLSSYGQLLLWQPVFQFRDIEPARRTRTTSSMLRGSDSGPYGVRPESQEKFKQVVAAAFEQEFHRTKVFAIADEPGPGTLIVASGVLDIVSNVPGSYTGTANIHLSSVGEATIVFELVDAVTGAIQARVAERRRIQPPGREYEVGAMPANSATVWADIERWARDEAQTLRRALEKAHDKPSD